MKGCSQGEHTCSKVFEIQILKKLYLATELVVNNTFLESNEHSFLLAGQLSE